MTTVEEPPGVTLSPAHGDELAMSCIAAEHIAARRYETLYGSEEDLARLKELRVPRWSWRDESAFPGLLLPMYRVTGEEIGVQFKPAVPQESPGGKRMKYASQTGVPNHLDVPPLSGDLVRDPTSPLWVTEGIKKGDCLASRGRAVITLTGVFNWRSKMGTLGDWEDVPLRGRTVVICFDSDARENRNVLLAMQRFGRWLESKGSQVMYLIVPEEVGGVHVKGVDDYFHAGGSMESLRDAAARELPTDGARDAAFSDAVLTDTVCSEELDGRFTWAAGLGWMRWTGKVWQEATDASVTEAVRLWALEQFNRTLDSQRTDPNRDLRTQIDGWRSVLSASKLANLVRLARGVLEAQASDFDADPDLINCPNGIVDLRTGVLTPHDPDQHMTKMTGTDYVKGATHPDWDQAMTALPADVRDWYQIRIGQAATGHMTSDDRIVVCQGGGENAKSTISDALAAALGTRGGYHVLVSDRVMLGSASDNHPTEIMDLMGARYAVLEETPEAKRLDTNRAKKLAGTAQITGRRIRQDPVTFDASHSLFINTNYKPIVDETDHGTWRRLALLRWPYTYRKTPAEVQGPYDRLADRTLRDRVKADPQVREAVLAWIVEGARRWYELGRIMPEDPQRVQADTLAWRKEADMILAYADEHLVFDRDSHVKSSELLEDVNRFLKDKGQREWGDKTFVARFGGHDLISRNGVEKIRAKNRPGLSRPDGVHTPAGVSYHAWVGVRFSTPGEGGDSPGTGPRDPFDSPGGGSGPVPPTAPSGPSPAPSEPVVDTPANTGSTPVSSQDVRQDVTGSSSDNVTSSNTEAQVKGGDQDRVPAVPAVGYNDRILSHIRVYESAGTAGTETEPFRYGGEPEPTVPAPREPLREPPPGVRPDDPFSDPETPGEDVPDDPTKEDQMQGETETAQTAVCGPEDPWVGYDFNDPFAEPQAAVQAVSGVPAADRPAAEVVTAGVLGFDIETGDADELFTYGSGFVRLTGAITEDGTKVLGDADNGGPEALVEMINRADAVYGHNILGFDGLALAYYHDLDWEAFCAKAIDTEVKARQADPPRSRGKSNADPYDLDHVAAKYGVPGKSDGLPKLKRKYGGYDKIPLDHAEYREYLEADLDATKGVADVLRASELSAYEKREHEILGLMGRMTLNGFKVDTDLLRTRTRQGEEKKQAALTELHERFGVPLGKEVYRGRGKARKLVFEPSKSPLATKEGKAALVTAIQDLTGQPHYPRTETGDLATGQDGMAKLKQVFGHLEGINEFADLVTTVTTTRTVYQTAATYLTKEGRVHPVVSMRQASGRGSVTKPGMTVFGKRNGKHHERDIFVADEGHVVITCDLSQVDMRGIAGHCQDPAYMELFQPGRDAHQEIADMLGISRHDAKARGHGWNYGLGAASMIRDGADPEVVYKFTNGMQEQFPVLCEWRDGVREKGGRGELLDNGFGRLMRCVPEWAYTVAPALMGQGTARDITCEVLLRLIRRHPEYRHYLRTWVHDEFVFSVPEDRVEEIGADIKEAFTWEWRGVPILCDLSAPGASWGDCSAK